MKYASIALVALVLAAYTNCSQTSFKSGATDGSSLNNANGGDGGGGDGNPPGNVPPETVQQALVNCDTAAANGSLKSQNQTVTFEDTKVESGRAQVCEFGVNGNLGKVNTFMQARYDQKVEVLIPANAVICDIDMTTALQQFKYDDVFLLTLNDQLLATNNKTYVTPVLSSNMALTHNGQTVPLLHYEWDKIRGQRFENVVDDYCLGKDQGLSTCTWPETQKVGNIQFDFDKSLLVNVGLKGAGNPVFGFTITGDDDASVDCHHEKVSFDVAIKYYLK